MSNRGMEPARVSWVSATKQLLGNWWPDWAKLTLNIEPRKWLLEPILLEQMNEKQAPGSTASIGKEAALGLSRWGELVVRSGG